MLKLLAAATLSLLFVLPAQAESVDKTVGVAVLDFELVDLTLQPQAQEIERAAKLKHMLEEHLASTFRIGELLPAAAHVNDYGFGYYASHPELARDLSDPERNRYLIIGRLHKPSYLFIYLQTLLIDINDGKVLGEQYVELKGQRDVIIARGVKRIAEQIAEAIAKDQSATGS